MPGKCGGGSGKDAAGATLSPPPYSSFQLNFIAGGGAGIVETVLTYPLDLVRTRIQMTRGASNHPTVAGLLVQVARESDEGPARLFRGLLPPLLSEVPRRALKFTANDFYKQRLLLLGGGDNAQQQGAYVYA